MREEVIPQKVGNRSGMAAKRRAGGVAQRPQRRDRDGLGQSLGHRLRAMLSYVSFILKVTLALAIGGLIFAGYRVASAASFFQIRKVVIQGDFRASATDVQTLVMREVAKTGVWRADLEEISTRLERLPWIRVAMVSRVLPDGIRVRLEERQPRVVVRTAAGRFLWVADDAVLLGEMVPTDQMPGFFLRGWNEESGDTVRKENMERLKRFLELQREWNASGLSERVSEVNVIDIRDVRAQLAGDDSQIEVRLGSQDFGKRLKDALNVLDAHRQTPRGQFISYVDLTQGRRAIVGFMSGAHAISDSADSAGNPSDTETRTADPAARPERNRQKAAANAARQNAEKKREAKPSRNETNGGERPRRARPTQ
ncbi:MAG TPA: FtsQ-type POTRA domain-containing protein [Pyrinomonadaceae bacterium]|nr:FtsQ-type POTRA domain-containing protein [Pyrinomonadaceae bacterium]